MEALIAARAVAGMGGGGSVSIIQHLPSRTDFEFSRFSIMTGEHTIYLCGSPSPTNDPTCSIECDNYRPNSIVRFPPLE